MIHEIKAFSATCDNCGEQFEHPFEGWSIFNSEDTLHDSLDSSGSNWHIEEDKHYCHQCYSIGDNDELIVNKDRTTQPQG